MTSKSLSLALRNAKELRITTFDPSGKPGTVPVWFVFDQGAFCILTLRESRKVQKLLRNPRAVVTLRQGRQEWRIPGMGKVIEDRGRVEGMRRLFKPKYGWDEYSEDYVLLEITPEEPLP